MKKKAEHSEKRKRKNKNKKSKKIKLIILVIIVILVCILGISTAVSANNFKKLILNMERNEASKILDINGNVIETICNEKMQNNVTLNEIPDNLKNAYVAIEDERYYKHGGIDVKRTISAIGHYVIHIGSSSYGGSTITQQLVKNLTGDNSTTITRKVNEWWKASVVDSAMTKDEILELYLNVIYTGPNIYGVESASQYYFNKSAQDLTLEECAFLAGINNSPNSYNPYSETDNTEIINKRTKIVLQKMEELEYITEEEAQTAIAKVDEGLNFKNGYNEPEDNIYSYHTDALLTQLISDMSKRKHISETFATNYINMAGLTIYSTQDSDIQTQMESEFSKSKYQLSSSINNDTSQAAMVIIDHETGNVIGCVGGLGEKTTSRGFNRATQAVRQTGSSIKPIGVLVPGISKRKFTASTIFSDEQQEFADGYSPEDYSDYLGDITVRRAVESSQNIPFVEMMEEIKPSNAMKYLKKMGITTLTEKDNNLALALGGLDKGITPLEMAGAYATIANDGVYIEPTFYTKVESSNNQIVIKTKQKKRRVFSKNVAYIIKELLTEPVTGSNGTAIYCAISGMEVAAKTGTTDENYDRWLCGFTPYYTAVSWYGFDQNESIQYGGKKNPAGIIWANVMSSIHKNLQNASFEKPQAVIKTTVCADSGKKANSSCSDTYEEYFLWGTVPGSCDIHTGTSTQNTQTNRNNKVTTNSFDTTTLDDIDNPVVQDNNTTENTTTKTDSTTYNNTKTDYNTVTNTTTNKNTTTTDSTTKTNTTTNSTTNKQTNTTTQQNTVKQNNVETKSTTKEETKTKNTTTNTSSN